MTKKFKTKMRKKSSARASRGGVQNVANARSTPSVEGRMVADASDPDAPEIAAFYEALLGVGRPVSQALCSDVPLVDDCLANLEPPMSRSFAGNGVEYGVQVTRVATSALGCVRFNITKARKAASIYSKAEVDVIGGLRLCPAVDPERGDSIALDLVAIFGGSGARTKVQEAFGRSREGDRYRRMPITWTSTGDFSTLESCLKDMFRPPWSRLPTRDPLYDPNAAFGDEWRQGQRALITLMCRSQLPLRKMLIGYGAGKAIASGAIGSVEHLLKGRCRAGPEVVHRDEVAHRWFDELRRRGLDHIAVPNLLLH